METVNVQIYRHYSRRYFRVRTARALFYTLLALGVPMILYYKSVLASVSVQITLSTSSLHGDQNRNRLSARSVYTENLDRISPSHQSQMIGVTDHLSQSQRSEGTTDVDTPPPSQRPEDTNGLDIRLPSQRPEGTNDFDIRLPTRESIDLKDGDFVPPYNKSVDTNDLDHRSTSKRSEDRDDLDTIPPSNETEGTKDWDLIPRSEHSVDMGGKVNTVERVMPVKPTGSKHWQKISQNGNLIVYGAYYNKHRSLGSVVQVIIVRKQKTAKQGHGRWPKELLFDCVLMYPSDKTGFYRTVTVKSTAFYLWSGHHSTRYRPGHICCKLPDGQRPLAVAITAGSGEPLNQVNINYEQLQRKPRTFTMCLSPLHFTNDVGKALVQYFELNKLLGAEYFYIYNLQLTDKTQKALDFYAKRNNTTVIPWKLPAFLRGESDMWYYAQTIALNDCFLRSKGNTKYLITTDLDEFIIPRASLLTWKNMMANEPDACAFNLECIVIDMTKKISVIKNENRKAIAQKLGLFSLLYQQRHTSLIPNKVKSKTIIKPDCYDGVNVHTPMDIASVESVKNVNSTKGVLYHYASPDANFLGNDVSSVADLEKTLMHYAADVIKKAGSVWKRLGRFKH